MQMTSRKPARGAAARGQGFSGETDKVVSFPAWGSGGWRRLGGHGTLGLRGWLHNVIVHHAYPYTRALSAAHPMALGAESGPGCDGAVEDGRGVDGEREGRVEGLGLR